MMKSILFTLLVLVTLQVRGQIANGGFEAWDTTYPNVYSNILDETFGIPAPLGGIIDHWKSSSGYGISRTTDSYSGDYSLILHNWYGYAWEWINYDEAISYRPQSFEGYYKYEASNINGTSHGHATVALTRFNGVTNDTIARGDYVFDDADAFTPFTIDFDYSSSLTPDSIHIYVINADRSCDTNIVCHFLYLDELNLSGDISAFHPVILREGLADIYPNPVQEMLQIESATIVPIQFELYNSLGVKLSSVLVPPGAKSLDLDELASGVYYYYVTDGQGGFQSGRVNKL